MTDFDYFCEMLRTHNRIVFFGGAGVSTESDIPDFRGTDGLYTKKTNAFSSFLCRTSGRIFYLI